MKIDGRYCVLLPKLNDEQLRILSERLSSTGFFVRKEHSLSARLRRRTIHIEQTGVCWAAFDPADAVAPVIPALLEVSRQTEPLEESRSRYFTLSRSEGVALVRFQSRVEHSRLWGCLRSSGECGLTPDELKVAKFVLGGSDGPCGLLTDFPLEGSKVRILGSKLYYESMVEPDEAAATLRGLGDRGPRNSYLPRSGTVRLIQPRLPPKRDLTRLLMNLGDWSGFEPESQKL
jgi:hypothetical protein